MRIFLTLILVFITLQAEQKVEVKAESFEADEKKNITIFRGDVTLTKGDDSLIADKVTIFFDKSKKPLHYEASGNVRFKVSVNEKGLYEGKSDKLVYEPLKNSYNLFGNVQVEDVTSERKLIGNEIMLDLDNGHAKVIGKKKKPVIMTFSIEEKSK